MEGQEIDYKDVVQNLLNMFGDVVTPDVIMAVVEHYGGDLQTSAEAVITIANDAGAENLDEGRTGAENLDEGCTRAENSDEGRTDVETSDEDRTGAENLDEGRTDAKNLDEDFAGAANLDENTTLTNDGMVQTHNSPDMTNSDTNIANQSPNTTDWVPQKSHSFRNTALASPWSPTRSPSPDIQNIPLPPPQVTHNQQSSSTSNASLPISYASASFQNTGAVPKIRPAFNMNSRKHIWSEQIKNIVRYHNEGSCLLILMRGASGSGKSYLAKQIIDMCIGASFNNHATHIFSTDNFFMVHGVYRYEKYRLSEAHRWNQQRVDIALRQGLSPVIVDNTNIELWEMEPYVSYGVRNGYIIEVVEPTTPWARNANQLQRKSSHNVPLFTIRRHLENLQSITGPELIRYFEYTYPAEKVPPVKRKLPVVEIKEKIPRATTNIVVTDGSSKIDTNTQPRAQNTVSNQLKIVNNVDASNREMRKVSSKTSSEDGGTDNNLDDLTHERYLQLEKALDDLCKIDEEWENGEAWDEHNQNKPAVDSNQTNSPTINPAVSQSQLHNKTITNNQTNSSELQASSSQAWTQQKNVLDPVEQSNWFMPPWHNSESTHDQNNQITISAVNDAATSIESGDTNLQNPKYKIVDAKPKDINIFYTPKGKEKIPQVRMLDKGTTTNDFEVTGAYRCKNTEQHFLSLSKMFKNIAKADLRDIFDNCCGDVNWAVDIIIDGMASDQLKTVENLPASDTEEEQVELCDCLAAYNLVPNSAAAVSKSKTEEEATVIPPVLTVAIPQKKPKITPSENTVLAKRQIEENFVIADSHYSQHCLKIRKMRRGELDSWNCDDNTTSDIAQALPSTSNAADENLLTTGPDFGPALGEKSPKSPLDSFDSDDDSSYIGSFNGDDPESVNINIGWGFIRRLDAVYGRPEFQYPEFVLPHFNIPMSMLNELNALWMHSLTIQMDENERVNNKLMQEDEILARRVQIEEEELTRQGKEPEVPDFKEIMDMDAAMSVYQKEVAQWREKEPTDLAARMTRDKLYNLFPDISQDTLSELLMAHDNNFKNTVESLLISTGQTDILKVKNGLAKFVMEKELARQIKILEQRQKELVESDWPCLPKGEKVDMFTVQKYRTAAEKQLQKRQWNFERASEYMNRSMPHVAQFYSGLAHYNTTQYERISSLAATCLMQIHASNSPNNSTIDLHFLRVVEAKQSLDMFLDQHISKLRDAQAKGPNHGPRVLKLFFITGRGVHSEGGRARVKPAVWKRLKDRGLTVNEKNPGLLTTKVSADDKLTFQVE